MRTLLFLKEQQEYTEALAEALGKNFIHDELFFVRGRELLLGCLKRNHKTASGLSCDKFECKV